jgi:hypothetical protein
MKMQYDPCEVARASYLAYVNKDRAAIDKLIADDFHFTSPIDNHIDRATYFARLMWNRPPEIDFDTGQTARRSRGSTSFILCRMAILCSLPTRAEARAGSASATSIDSD